MKNQSYLFAQNSALIEELYEKYLKNPSSIDQSWIEFFQSMPPESLRKPKWYKGGPKICFKNQEPQEQVKVPSPTHSTDYFSSKVKLWMKQYREKGHFYSKLDPLEMEKTPDISELDPINYGFTTEDLSRQIGTSSKCNDFPLQNLSLINLAAKLKQIYCKDIGYEFSYLLSREEKNWLYNYIETQNIAFQKEDQLSILQDLVEAEGLEEYLHVKFPGAKRFSAEGGESSIMALSRIIKQAALGSTQEVVIGMAHRGRLNTLTKVMGKPYSALFAEFAGAISAPKGFAGDVKYHMGYSSDLQISDQHKIHLTLTPNPSHLEAVNPVNEGRVRAKQDLIKDKSKILGILIHGDAAFCGQGVVFESLAMSVLEPYYTNGTIHIVVNNQVGFTANPKDGRAGRYPTEIAKSIEAPIIHVNGDSPESVAFVSKLALDYRQKFGKNIVIDIVCYRKYGHNEGDEPFFTQSVMYNTIVIIIKNKQTPALSYANQLVSLGQINSEYYQNVKNNFKAKLDQEFEESKNYTPQSHYLEGLWSNFIIPQDQQNYEISTSTGVEKSKLQDLNNKLCSWPEDFPINPKIKKLLESRKESINNNEPIDWATAEALAFATLLEEGFAVRITGQDAGRGTFSHRHSVLHSQKEYEKYIPLNNLSPNNPPYYVADSNLSEYGVLGFEYGYSMVNPKALVIWEAQFGDFSNGAQIIFDQFISSGETKWQRCSGLVVLLPHGMEGQGPEHSSARLERYLQLCAEYNMQVCSPSTPASIFHLLRRQMHSNFRKPLIIMSPKSLLRNKFAVSSLSDLDLNTSFMPVIKDNIKEARKVIICAGKIYYDLLAYREEKKIQDIALIRLEQYYPFPDAEMKNIISQYSSKPVYWCQEESKNMGAWNFIRDYLEEFNVQYIGRPASASPAVGYLKLHNAEQAELIQRIFA